MRTDTMRLQKTLVTVVYLICPFRLCYGNDWHFSIASMSELFDLEVERIKAVETYISNEYKRLDNIRR